MNTPNKLTCLRMALVPVFFVAAYMERGRQVMIFAAVIFAVASFTDFLDGYLARKHNLVTDFGKFMDPLADKVLVAAALIFLVEIGRAEAYLVVIIIAREYAISIIRAIAAAGGHVIAASGGGKIKTATQMISILLLLLAVPYGNILFYISVLLTLYSGIEYIWKNKTLISQR